MRVKLIQAVLKLAADFVKHRGLHNRYNENRLTLRERRSSNVSCSVRLLASLEMSLGLYLLSEDVQEVDGLADLLVNLVELIWVEDPCHRILSLLLGITCELEGRD